MSPLAIYVTVALGALALGIGTLFIYPPPTRMCHQCERRVSIMARRCRHCGYRFL